jgi:hypothetical protein
MSSGTRDLKQLRADARAPQGSVAPLTTVQGNPALVLCRIVPAEDGALRFCRESNGSSSARSRRGRCQRGADGNGGGLHSNLIAG